MSNFTGHFTAAITVSCGIIGATSIFGNDIGISLSDSVFPAFLSLFFALFPDIDIKSVISKIIYAIIGVALILCLIYEKYYYANIIAIFSVIPQIVNHRGFFHSVFAAFGIPLFLLYFLYDGIFDFKLTIFAYIASVMGYLSHLMLDYT